MAIAGLRVSILDCRSNGVHWAGVRITQGQVGLRECSLVPAVGSVGLCWREGGGAAGCTQAPVRAGREASTSAGQRVGHRRAAGEMREDFFPTVYTTQFGSAKS